MTDELYTGWALGRVGIMESDEDRRYDQPRARKLIMPRPSHLHSYERQLDGSWLCRPRDMERHLCLVPTLPPLADPHASPSLSQRCAIELCPWEPGFRRDVCSQLFCDNDWSAHQEAERGR